MPGSLGSDETFGEVSVQIDLFTYHANGEHKVTVKGTLISERRCFLYRKPALSIKNQNHFDLASYFSRCNTSSIIGYIIHNVMYV